MQRPDPPVKVELVGFRMRARTVKKRPVGAMLSKIDVIHILDDIIYFRAQTSIVFGYVSMCVNVRIFFKVLVFHMLDVWRAPHGL
jgi:hypothetical protein